MKRILTRIPVAYSEKDQEFISQLAQDEECSESEVLRKLVDKYLENSIIPSIYDPKEQSQKKLVHFYKEQVAAMDGLCRKYGNCPRVDLIREAIQIARLRKEGVE